VDLDGLFAETALAGVCLIQDGQFRYVNPAFARLFGYDRAELVDRLGPRELIAADDQGWIEESWGRLREGMEPSIGREVRGRTRQGSALDVQVMIAAVSYRGQPAAMATLLDITERKRAEREAAEKRAEIEALYRAASRLMGTMDMEALIREVVAAGEEEFGTGHVSLFLLDEEGRVLHQAACSSPELQRGLAFPLDGPGLTVLAARTAEIVHVADVSTEPRYIRGPAHPGAELVIPLTIGERVLGVLNFESPVTHAFSGRDIVVLKAFADRAATAVDMARLHQHLQERTRQLERFHELALMMVGDPAAIYQAIVGQVRELLRAPYAFIVRMEGDVIRSVAAGTPGEERAGVTFPIDLTPCLAIRDARESRIIRNVVEEFPHDAYLRDHGIRTYIGVPLLDRRGEVMGILNAMDPRDRVFGAEELRILSLLGRRAAEELEEERHQREKETTERRLLQSEKMVSLGQVVAGVAHELNNPLASVLGFAELLSRRQDLPESVRETLLTVVAEAERARQVIRNLLAFAREHAPERTPALLNEVVERTLALREGDMKASGVEVARDLAPDLPATLADAHLLQQAFLNLVLNAEQAMLQARGRGRLTVRTRFLPQGSPPRPGAAVRVEFEDDGPGVPEESLRKIFEPFFTTKEVGKGTGLGLSLTHSIVEQHGGAVWVENAGGGGARFTIELPYVPSPPAPAPDPGSPPPPPPPVLRGKRVLVVEDEEALREIVREVLESEGCQVMEAGDGRAALALLAAQRFDLVISDMKMPEMGGVEVYRLACASEPSLAHRFLFVTGDWVSEDTARFLEQSGCAHLEKPYHVDQLVKRVSELLA
jgi:two-component system NtrC family sensor kinase